MQHRTEINIKQLIFFFFLPQSKTFHPNHIHLQAAHKEKRFKKDIGVKNGANTVQSLLHILFSVS